MNAREEAQGPKRISLSVVTPVHFRFQGKLAPTAARVALVGTFNGWNPRSHLLTKNREGDWMITVHFPLRSRIVYHFEVDGVPWLDPADDERVPNGWGSEYSVRHVRRAIGPPGTALARGPEPPRSNRGAVPPRQAGVSRNPEARQLSAGAQVLEIGVTEGG